MNRMTRRSARRAASAAVLALCLALFAGCGEGTFRTMMEGSKGSAWTGALSIGPSSATVLAGGSLRLEARGGDGSYSFEVVGGGSFDPLAMTFTAPASTGTVRVVVTDGAGRKAEALIAVKAAMSPDYRVAASPAAVFPGSGAAGDAFSGSFAIENIAAEPGSAAVAWTVYLSRDAVLDPLDPIAASGGLAALAANAVSANLSFSGAWPAAPGSYHLVIALGAADDANAADDTSVSPAIDIAGSADRPDYGLSSISAPTLALCSKAFSQSFVVANGGGGDGASPLSWKVYLSADKSPDASDTLLSTDPASPLATGLAAGASATVTFTGSFPATPGTCYLVATVSSFDDGAAGTKSLASAPILVSGPDYEVAAVGAPTGAMIAGQTLGGTVTIRNVGPVDGSRDIEWSVYASANAVFDEGDALLKSGSRAALAAGASATVAYEGTWPRAEGGYYLIARTRSADDATLGERASTASYAVDPPDVDYAPSDLALDPAAAPRAPGGIAGGTFRYRNLGTSDGLSSLPVAWSVFASRDATLDPGDYLVASDSGLSALAAGETSASVSWEGTWPLQGDNYSLFVAISDAEDIDDANNALMLAAPVAVGVYDEAEENGDIALLKNVYKPGLVLAPGMRIKIRGSLRAKTDGDKDDVIELDTGTAGTLLVKLTWDKPDPSLRIRLMTAAGAFASTAQASGPAAGAENSTSLSWIVDSPGALRWIDLDNRWDGWIYNDLVAAKDDVAYTCVISAQ